MPFQEKLALVSAAPVNKEHTPGHVNCPACLDIRQQLEFGGDVSAMMSFHDATEVWLQLRQLGGEVDRQHFVSPRTLRDNGQYLRTLEAFFGEMRLCDIHPGHLRQYQTERVNAIGLFEEIKPSRPGKASRKRKPARPAKVNQELGTLSMILQDAHLWTAEFVAKYRPLKVETPDIPRALSQDEQSHFLEVAARRESWRVVYWYSILSLQTTAAPGEMRGLHLGDVNLFGQILMIRSAYAKNRYRVRTIPLTADALWAVDRLLQRARAHGAVDPGHYLFPFYVNRYLWDPCRPMTYSGIKRQWIEVREEAGFPWLREEDLRHCAITRMAEAGVPIAVIMSMAGHISPRMTQHYTHICEQAKRRAIDASFRSVKTISEARSWKDGPKGKGSAAQAAAIKSSSQN